MLGFRRGFRRLSGGQQPSGLSSPPQPLRRPYSACAGGGCGMGSRRPLPMPWRPSQRLPATCHKPTPGGCRGVPRAQPHRRARVLGRYDPRAWVKIFCRHVSDFSGIAVSGGVGCFPDPAFEIGRRPHRCGLRGVWSSAFETWSVGLFDGLRYDGCVGSRCGRGVCEGSGVGGWRSSVMSSSRLSRDSSLGLGWRWRGSGVMRVSLQDEHQR
jgi:hypothetical protein